LTVGSGLSISIAEKDPVKQNGIIRQLIEGRSNAVGTVTLAHDGVATTTTVTAPTCGPNSIVLLTPLTAHAAAVVTGVYVLAASVTPGQFVITHAATAESDRTFGWFCVG
jgi:hypothetical protein